MAVVLLKAALDRVSAFYKPHHSPHRRPHVNV